MFSARTTCSIALRPPICNIESAKVILRFFKKYAFFTTTFSRVFYLFIKILFLRFSFFDERFWPRVKRHFFGHLSHVFGRAVPRQFAPQTEGQYGTGTKKWKYFPGIF